FRIEIRRQIEGVVIHVLSYPQGTVSSAADIADAGTSLRSLGDRGGSIVFQFLRPSAFQRNTENTGAVLIVGERLTRLRIYVRLGFRPHISNDIYILAITKAAVYVLSIQVEVNKLRHINCTTELAGVIAATT